MVRAEQLHEEDQRAWRKQEEEEEQGQKKHDADSANTAALPPELYTRVAALGLKEGEKLRISLGRAMEGVAAAGGGSSSSSKHRHTPTLSASSPGGVAAVDAPLLPPPPGDRAPAPMKGVAPTSVVAAAQEMQPARGEGEEEWGDFEVA